MCCINKLALPCLSHYLHFSLNQFFNMVIMICLHSKGCFADIYCHFIQDLNFSVLIYHFNCAGKCAITLFLSCVHVHNCVLQSQLIVYTTKKFVMEKKVEYLHWSLCDVASCVFFFRSAVFCQICFAIAVASPLPLGLGFSNQMYCVRNEVISFFTSETEM